MSDQMTTRQRASGILSAAKMRMLEEAGITVVSAAEWYQMQAHIGELHWVLRELDRLMEFDYPLQPETAWFENVTEINEVMSIAKKRLADDKTAREVAERILALEKLREAIKVRSKMEREIASLINPTGYIDPRERTAWDEWGKANDDISEAMSELEAMDSVSDKPSSP